MMQDSDKALRRAVRDSWPAGKEPAFDTTWQAAEERHARGRRRYRYLAGAAAIVAAAVIAIYGQAPQEPAYIEVADLLDSTWWSAPSDALLPDRQFDIYQDMPEVFESTEPAGGSLL